MKKSLAFLLCLVFIFISCCSLAAADNNKCGSNAYWKISNGTLTISGSGSMYDYSGGTKTPWYNQRNSITKIVVEKGITTIGKWCFSWLIKLNSVSLPSTLLKIEDFAFANSSMKEITIPEGCKTLCNCIITSSGIQTLSLPSTLESITFQSFSSKGQLTTIKYNGTKKNWENLQSNFSSYGRQFFEKSLEGVNIIFSKKDADGLTVRFADYYEFTLPSHWKLVDSGTPDDQYLTYTPYGMNPYGQYGWCFDWGPYSDALWDWCINPYNEYNKDHIEYGEKIINGISTTYIVFSIDSSTKRYEYYFRDSEHVVGLYCYTFADNNRAAMYLDYLKTLKSNRKSGDLNKIKEFVERCYSLILGRHSDAAGLDTWSSTLATGTSSAAGIISRFLSSEEFLNRHLGSEQIVEILYKTMLGRSADIEGKRNWVQVMNTNGISAVVNGFCVSKEFTGLCNQYGIVPGKVDVDIPKPTSAGNRTKIEAFVTRSYSIILSRQPDAGGLKYWADALESGKQAASDIINGFVNSPEFLNKHLSYDAAVDILYRTMLNRGPDPAGLAYWVNLLKRGQPFAVVINGFCNSPEFIAICNEYGIKPGYVAVKGASEYVPSDEPEESVEEDPITEPLPTEPDAENPSAEPDAEEPSVEPNTEATPIPDAPVSEPATEEQPTTEDPIAEEPKVEPAAEEEPIVEEQPAEPIAGEEPVVEEQPVPENNDPAVEAEPNAEENPTVDAQPAANAEPAAEAPLIFEPIELPIEESTAENPEESDVSDEQAIVSDEICNDQLN